MKNEELFQMRQLQEKDLEQFNALLRYVFQVTGDELVKSGWEEEEIQRAKAPILRNAYVLGWFHNEKLASQVVVYPMEVNVFGEIYKMGGITGVATYPEFAGRGLIHTLMTKILEHMRDEKQSISFLYPYSIPFYRKKGWEIVSDKIWFNLTDTQLPKKQPVSGMVERVDWNHEDLKNVYKYFAIQRHGALIRDDLAWEEYWRWESDDETAAIYYNEDHKPLGYLVYSIENEVLHIKELLYLNIEARYGLWNYISSHFSMITEVTGFNYTGEPLAFLLEDGEITEIVSPYIMARIVDVKEFVLQYPFQVMAEDFHIHLIVHDEMAPWNEGEFQIYWKEQKTYFQQDLELPLTNIVELDIGTLTTMLMGYKRPSYLYENGMLKMEYYMVQILERMIPVGKPYFSDYY